MSVRNILIAGLTLLALAATSCGGSGNGFDAEHMIQRAVEPGVAQVVTLPSNASVTFPANSFAIKSIIIFSDELSGSDTYAPSYPVASETPEDRLASVVVNTPSDRVIGADISVRLPVRNGITLTPSTDYVVYRFDFDNQHWNRWGAVTATIDSTGTLADCVLPTTGFRGFIGSLAIFDGLTEASQPAVIPTVIQGTVVTIANVPVANTDVGVYHLVGSTRYPIAVAGGRIPSINDPSTGLPSVVANTVDTAADGSFELVLPENMIGQTVALEFCNEDPNFATQRQYDVLPPTDEFNDYENVEIMVLWYGVNIVRSLGVRGT